VKDCSTQEIIDAVNMAAAGEPALSEQFAISMLDEVHRLDADDDAVPQEHVVSKREEEVLQLIVDGCSTVEIGERLFISTKTVKNHLAAIYTKLEAATAPRRSSPPCAWASSNSTSPRRSDQRVDAALGPKA